MSFCVCDGPAWSRTAIPLFTCEIPQTPTKTKYWVRLFGFLVDANIALGEVGHRAAKELAAELVETWHPATAFVFLLTSARRAKELGQAVPEGHADVLQRLAKERRARRERCSWVYAPPLEKQLGLAAVRTA